ncbi:MAG: hypothetical protein HY329_16365 [Chloroflexi bacterium]|nr:hypothetical protein [Chloroflexota bacterium]
MPMLMIVICSTHPGRVGLPIGRWFHQRAVEHGDFEVDLVDLKELALPFVVQMIDQGQLHSTDATDAAAKAMLDELVRWEGLLRPARASVKPA